MYRKNIIKLPISIRHRLQELGSNEVVAACTRQFSTDDAKSGKLGTYGITVGEEGAKVGQAGAFEPPAGCGKYSRRNCRGMTVIHKNEPKVPKEIEMTVKDWHGNPISVSYMRDCYRRSMIDPKHIKIDAKVIRVEQDKVVVAFKVNEPLNPGNKDFQDRLLAGLNLLQENVGVCNVELASTDMEKYQHILRVNWTMLPPGSLTAEELACRVFGRAGMADEKIRKDIKDRYEFLMSLNATNIVVGADSFHGYIGAMLENDIVVFDNVKFGNAVYILQGDWKELSKKTKRELWELADVSHRIQHFGEWKNKVKEEVRRLRRDKEG